MCRVVGEVVLSRLCPKAKHPHCPSAIQNSQNPSLSSIGCNAIPLSEVQIQLLLCFNKLDFLHCFRDRCKFSEHSWAAVPLSIHRLLCVCVCVHLCIAVRFCLYILPNHFGLTILKLHNSSGLIFVETRIWLT